MESDKIIVSERDVENQVVQQNFEEENNSFKISDEAKEQSRKFFKFGSKPKKEKRKFESFEIVKTFTPKEKTNKNNEFDKILEVSNNAKTGESVISMSEKTQNQKVKMKLRPRGKLILIAISVIIILLSTLSISNAIKINSLQSDCNNLANQITVEDLKIDKAIKDLGKLSDEAKSNEQAIRLELEQATDFTEIELYSRCEKVEIKSTSNWFDVLCNFISKIFGG